MKIAFGQAPLPHKNLYSALVYTSDTVDVAVQMTHPEEGVVAPHDHVDEGLVEILHLDPGSTYSGLEGRDIGRDVYVIKPSVNGGLHGGHQASRGSWISIKVHQDAYLRSEEAALGAVHYLKHGAISVGLHPTFVLNSLGQPHTFLTLPPVGDPEKPYAFEEVYDSDARINHGTKYLGILQ